MSKSAANRANPSPIIRDASLYPLVLAWIYQLGLLLLLLCPFVSLSCTDLNSSYKRKLEPKAYTGLQVALVSILPDSPSKTKKSNNPLDSASTSRSQDDSLSFAFWYYPGIVFGPGIIALPITSLSLLTVACVNCYKKGRGSWRIPGWVILLTFLCMLIRFSFLFEIDGVKIWSGLPLRKEGPPIKMQWLSAYWSSFFLDFAILASLCEWFLSPTYSDGPVRLWLKRGAYALGFATLLYGFSVYYSKTIKQTYIKDIKIAYLLQRDNRHIESLECLSDASLEHRGWEWYFIQRNNHITPHFRYTLGDAFVDRKGYELELSQDGDKLLLKLLHETSVEFRIFSLKTGQNLGSLRVEEQVAAAIDSHSSPDKVYVYHKNAIRRYRIDTGKSDWSIDIQETATWDYGSRLLVVDQGRTLVAILDNAKKLEIWDIESKQLRKTQKTDRGTYIAGSQPDTPSIFCLGGSGTVARLDSSTGDTLETFHIDSPVGRQQFDFSKNAKRVVISRDDLGHTDGGPVLYEEGREILTFPSKHDARCLSVRISPDGRRLASLLQLPSKNLSEPQMIIDLFDTSTGACIHTIHHGTGFLSDVRFSPDSKWLIGFGFHTPNEFEVNWTSPYPFIDRWDVSGLEVGLVLRGHTQGIEAIVCSPDGKYISTRSKNGEHIVFDIETGIEATEPNAKKSYGVFSSLNARQGAVSPNGRSVAVCQEDGGLVISNKNKGLLASRIPVVQKGCKTVCWTTDGSRLIAGTKDGLICVVDPHSGATMLVFQAHRSDITCLAVTPDGRKIVSGGSDGLVKIWDASAPY